VVQSTISSVDDMRAHGPASGSQIIVLVEWGATAHQPFAIRIARTLIAAPSRRLLPIEPLSLGQMRTGFAGDRKGVTGPSGGFIQFIECRRVAYIVILDSWSVPDCKAG
jgi:hypothetical protein